MHCKNCGHKLVCYLIEQGKQYWKHIRENDLGYCHCGCRNPVPEVD